MSAYPSLRYLIREGFIKIEGRAPRQPMDEDTSWNDQSMGIPIELKIEFARPYRIVNKYSHMFTLMIGNKEIESMPISEALDIANVRPPEEPSW